MRKKLTMLLASLFLVLGTAWADISTTWTTTTPWVKTGFTAPEGVTTLAGSKSVAMLEVPVKVTAEQVTVSFKWTGNNCALNMLGVDLVNRTTEEVVKSHYASLKTGGGGNTITYTLDGLTAGDKYALRYFSWYNSSEKLHESEGNISIVGAIASEYIPGKVYQLKNMHDSYHVYDAGAGANNKLKPIAPGSVDSESDGSIAVENYEQLWVLRKSTTSGKFTLRNAETKGYMKPGGEWSTSKEMADLYVVERTQATDNAPAYFNLSSAADAAGSTNLHCWANTSVGINWEGNGGGSQFAFIEVTTVTIASLAALAITEDLNPNIAVANGLKDNAALVGSQELTTLTTALTTANGLTSSQDWDAVLAAADALATAIDAAEAYIEANPETPVTPEATNLYALQSPTGTYFNFTAVTVEGNTTPASFQQAPSYFYMKASGDNWVFQNYENETRFIGSTHGWNVTTEESAWSVSNADADGLVLISRTVGSGNLGHDSNTNAGTGIFTNVGNGCFKWKLIPAYPITIIYMYNGNEIDRVKAGVLAGESYTVDTKDLTVASCITDKGTIQENAGAYMIPAVNGATTVTVTFAEVDKYAGSNPTITDDEIGTVKDYGQYLTALTLGSASLLSDGVQPSSASDMHVRILGKSVDVTQGTEYSFTLTFAKNPTNQALVARVWMDKDGEGTYETLLSTTGTAEKYSDLKTVKFTVPHDATPGVTRIRLRLDGAWAISQTADGATKRMVYDIEVNVVEAPKTDITYNLIYKGQKIATENIRAVIGANFPAPTTEFKIDTQYLTFTLPEGTVGENPRTFDVDVAIAKGFPTPTTISDGAFAENTKWYLATLRNERVKYNGSTEVVTTTDKVFSDAHLFALTGDPVNGFQFYNKALGTGKAIYSNDPVNLDNSNPTPVELTETPDGTWSVTSNSHGGFSFVIENNSTNYYLHEKNDKLSFWQSSAAKEDAGSSLIFKEAYDFTFFVTGVPEGEDAGVTFSGNSIVNGAKIVETEYVSKDLFNANDIEGYSWSVTVDKNAKAITLAYQQAVVEENPKAVVDLVDRIGGAGTADKFKFVLDPSINSKQETFVLGAEEGKILIKGTTISAITTGIGWYLNNVAKINIAWNSLNEKTVDVKKNGAAYADLSNLPLPSTTETHSSDAKYRYYLNTCTFGYSMTSWTWTRWQQEIDWMALHGINMPLQLVGLEEVWRTFLVKCGYSETDAKAFVAGPAFIAWWAMNNLQGWGGTAAGSKSGYNNLAGAGGVQDDAWYARQKKLAKQIVDAQRALGMQPVIPGWSGMVPTNFNAKTGYTTRGNGGNWAGDFVRPLLLHVNNANYAEIAADYYECLHAVMGESQYYSMDPFHEGGGAGTMEDYEALYAAMEAAKPGSQWVIQQWQWSATQKYSLTAVPEGRLIVLDLFSDGSPAFDGYNGYAPQDAVFCAIPNFGGRSGLMGRLQNVTDNYFKFKGQYASIKGIGTAPEAIEQTPVTYDLIYQLPWMNGTKPNVADWVANYSIARYGKDNAVVKEAWSLLRQGPLNYGADGIQGPVEDVWAARPNLDANKASSWGVTLANAGGTYTPARRQMLIDAVYKLIDQEDELELVDGSVYKSNYLYDLVEFGGAVMADYAYDLLLGIKAAKNAEGTSGATYIARRDAFLQLILDMDAFRGTNLNFRLGKWTQEARDAAGEVENATTATPNWYEYNNARTILTTWSSPGTNLTDYSYRSWQGLLKDYYYKRWKHYFDNNCQGAEYQYFEWNWAHGKEHYVGQTGISNVDLTEEQDGHTSKYTREPVGNTVEEAVKMLGKYIIPVKKNDGSTYYAYRTFTTDLTGKATVNVIAGSIADFTVCFNLPVDVVGTVTGSFTNGEAVDITKVPVPTTEGTYTATITLTDGTVLSNFTVNVVAPLNGYYYVKYNDQPVFVRNHMASSMLWPYYSMGDKMIGKATGVEASETEKIFLITPSKDGNGYTLSVQGKYMGVAPYNPTSEREYWDHIIFSEDEATAGKYVFEGANLYKLRCLNVKDARYADYAYVGSYGGDPEIFGNDVRANAVNFSFVPVTSYLITVPNEGITTLYLPFNVVLPDGVVAYDICNLSDEKLAENADLMEVVANSGETLKAETAVIIKAEPGRYNLQMTTDDTNAKTSLEGSVLRGSLVDHVLTYHEGDAVKKFLINGDRYDAIRTRTTVPANTCWIEAELKDATIDLNPHYIEIPATDEENPNAPAWKFKVREKGKGLAIVDCIVESSGALTIASEYEFDGEMKEVIALSDKFLYDNKNLTEITLPRTLSDLGASSTTLLFEQDYKGDGVMHQAHPLKEEVMGDATWVMTVDVTIADDAADFNGYGSCLLATKEATLDDWYDDGSMQLYLKKGHSLLIFKLDNADDRYTFKALDEAGNPLAADKITFTLENDGSGTYTAKAVFGKEGDNGEYYYTEPLYYDISAKTSAELNDFATVWSSMPKGIDVAVKFEEKVNSGLLVGCTNLKAIHVEEGNESFKSCEHGVLYNVKKDHVMRFPEGGGHIENGRRHFEVPYTVTRVNAGALHGVDADITFHSNPAILHVAGHEDHMVAKYYLSLEDAAYEKNGVNYAVDFISGNKNTYQTARYERAPLKKKNVFGTFMLPFAPENALDKYDFFELTDASGEGFTFSQVTELKAKTPYIYRLKQDFEVTVAEGDEVENDVFETDEAFTVEYLDKFKPLTEPGFVALGAYVNNYIEMANFPNTGNYYLYSSDDNKLHRVTKKLTYRPYRVLFVWFPENNQETSAPAKLSMRLRGIDGSTTEIDAAQIEGMEESIFYDLMGRRVMNPTNGVYIVNGKKIIVK